eukprot:TRINITY_DN30607_c0_g1_i1.p1 TRINITY_DN30607_c0_g1~~TRINITY_DN30607_c0_g1_i1.p1  ORF type:complete len:153 (+),score=30.44 TRINITY_DN30607_c0_g1_i1:142-600(+)
MGCAGQEEEMHAEGDDESYAASSAEPACRSASLSREDVRRMVQEEIHRHGEAATEVEFCEDCPMCNPAGFVRKPNAAAPRHHEHHPMSGGPGEDGSEAEEGGERCAVSPVHTRGSEWRGRLTGRQRKSAATGSEFWDPNISPSRGRPVSEKP